MARYNEFIARIECPHCKQDVEGSFQADIGILEYTYFKLGDNIFDSKPNIAKPEIRPDRELENKHFWAYGLAYCPSCHEAIWAKIAIHMNTFEAVSIINYEPANIYG